MELWQSFLCNECQIWDFFGFWQFSWKCCEALSKIPHYFSVIDVVHGDIWKERKLISGLSSKVSLTRGQHGLHWSSVLGGLLDRKLNFLSCSSIYSVLVIRFQWAMKYSNRNLRFTYSMSALSRLKDAENEVKVLRMCWLNVTVCCSALPFHLHQ